MEAEQIAQIAAVRRGCFAPAFVFSHLTDWKAAFLLRHEYSLVCAYVAFAWLVASAHMRKET